ncbi:MAG: YdhR family protein [Anaerolineae bacterium]|nr:YdhR family protein [Anaerolineae bacterium]
MITEIITFKIPNGMTREETLLHYEASAKEWRANPDLIRKNYLYDGERGIAGGVYLWREKAHAEKWHGEKFRRRIRDTFNAVPETQIFETPIVVDNVAGAIIRE